MAIKCKIISHTNKQKKCFDRKVGILIPAYNEVAHIAEVIEACRALEPEIIFVVDDCSSDATPLILEKEIKNESGAVKVRALRNVRNLGKQGSVRRGLRILSDYGLDAVCLIDGDSQHDPAELPGLVALLDEFDFVIGARSKKNMPLQRKLSNWLVNLGFQLIGGVNFVDVQSGLRVYRKEMADVLGDRLCEEGGYALEHESLTVLANFSKETGCQLRVAAAPISCAYGKAASSIQPFHVLQLGYETIRQALRLRKAIEEPAYVG
ncbi:MAG: glycosyltransferase family 2 protein [Deltaproteobacteria bacterium]|nr:glycosyltransferase family 2 protein [Deltaproteobacteria bacterium]